MVQARHRSSFAFESFAKIGPVREVRGKNFDRDYSVKPRVARSVNFSHPARAERLRDFVRS
jgi:hypothetical protein